MPYNSASASVEERLRKVFVDPKTASEVVDLVVRNRPPGWSRRSNSPYYQKKYAVALKPFIDEMIKNRLDLVYRYDQFPTLKPSSLYLVVNQSIRFLIEELDDEQQTYRNWYKDVHVYRERGVGIRITFLVRDDSPAANAPSSIVPSSVMPRHDTPKWKDKLDEFLETGALGEKLLIDKLCLTPDEIKAVKESLMGLSGVISSVTAQHIKVIKTNVNI